MIWRRVTFPGFMTLEHLHYTIQNVFDWEETHLHVFKIKRRQIGCPVHWEEEAHKIEDQFEVRFDALELKPKQKFHYVYDFGDGWRHAILVEKREAVPLSPTPKIQCVGGECRAPIEDSGGPGGWARLIEAVRDRSHPEHRERRRWAGGPIDPNEFDLASVRKKLKAL